jgi:hypothetical protein
MTGGQESYPSVVATTTTVTILLLLLEVESSAAIIILDGCRSWVWHLCGGASLWAWICQQDRNWNKRIFVKATVLVAYTKSSRENLQRKKAGGDDKVVAESLERGKHKQERS